MAPILYGYIASPPVRTVLMTIKHLDLDVEFRSVNPYADEHKSAEFLKVNPQHSIPTLDDNGFVLWDSHTICMYLAEKYGKDDSLYPKNVQERALVNQRLFFDDGIFFPRLLPVHRAIRNGIDVEQKYVDAVTEAYRFIEGYLENTQFVSGDFLTIADFSMHNTFTLMEVMVPIDAKEFPRIAIWDKKMKALPHWEQFNKEGIDTQKKILGKYYQ